MQVFFSAIAIKFFSYSKTCASCDFRTLSSKFCIRYKRKPGQEILPRLLLPGLTAATAATAATTAAAVVIVVAAAADEVVVAIVTAAAPDQNDCKHNNDPPAAVVAPRITRRTHNLNPPNQ